MARPKSTMIPRVCERCGVTFYKPAGRLKFEPARFCSTACRVARIPLADRFWPKVSRLDGGCWRWTGMIDKAGYGRIRDGDTGQSLYAHRVSYEMHRGHVPAGLELDHLCRNRWCVNPDHMEAVTHRANYMRGVSKGALAVRTGQCHRGHEWTPENTYIRVGKPNERVCRACARERDAKRRKRRKEPE
jgi:hypothetical protein